jgi:hypothetical protein
MQSRSAPRSREVDRVPIASSSSMVLDPLWLLWNWRVPDPENEGGWRRDEVGVTSFDAKTSHWIGIGAGAAFSADGMQVFWLQPRDPEQDGSPTNLVWRSVHGGRTVRIAAGVDAFAVLK